MKKQFLRTVITLSLGMVLGSATLAAAAPGTVEGVLTKFKIVVNGQEEQLSNTPVVIKGTTYLPVREVAGLLDAGLNYDGKNKTIELSTKGASNVNQSFDNKPETSSNDPVKFKINEEVTHGDMTLKLNKVTYADFIPSEPGSQAGTFPNAGYKFAIINFDIRIDSEPKERFEWYSIDFLESATVSGKNINGSFTVDDYTVTPRNTKTVDIAISIPNELSISSLTFRNPSTQKTFGSVDLQ